MNESELTPVARLYRFAARPVYLVKVICQMLIGLGLAIALIVKIYMFVLTDHQCLADAITLGNKIRCTDSLAIMAYALALSAGFELAYRMFGEGIQGVIDPLIVGVSSAFLLIVSSLTLEKVDWQLALLLTSLTISIGALLYCKERFALNHMGKSALANHQNQSGNQEYADQQGSDRYPQSER